MRISAFQRVMLAIAVALAVASCGAQLAAGAARAAASGAEAKAKSSAAAAGVALTPLPQPKSAAEADDQVKHWQDVAEQARMEAVADRSRASASDARAAAADAQAAIAETRAEALRLELWRSRLAWAAGLMLVGILAGVALEFILPAQLRGWATIVITAATAVAIAAWILRALLPWLKVVALAAPWLVIVAAMFLALRWVWKFKHAAAQAGDHGDRMEEVALGTIDWMDAEAGAVVRQSIAETKSQSAKLQQSAGVATILAHLRGKDPAKAAAAAAQPLPPPILPPAPPSPAEAPTEVLKAIAPPAADQNQPPGPQA